MSRAVLLRALALAAPAGVAMAQPPRALNPHWSPDGCTHCHAGTNQSPLPIAQQEIDAICLRCHDGRLASREPHPTGRPFPESGITRPAGWPARGGRVSCVTCHQIDREVDHNRPRPGVNPAFVREYDTADPAAFCARCHVPAPAQQVHNPHLMLTPSGQIEPQACAFCHVSGIERAILSQRTGDPRLKSPEPVLCMGCHVRHVDYFEPGHTGAPVDASMKAYMARSGKAGGDASTHWPLAPGDVVTCSTCHNPHAEGVFSPGSILAEGALGPRDEPGPAGLRGSVEGFCRACHQP